VSAAGSLAATGAVVAASARDAVLGGPLDAPITGAKFRKMDRRDFTAESRSSGH